MSWTGKKSGFVPMALRETRRESQNAFRTSRSPAGNVPNVVPGRACICNVASAALSVRMRARTHAAFAPCAFVGARHACAKRAHACLPRRADAYVTLHGATLLPFLFKSLLLSSRTDRYDGVCILYYLYVCRRRATNEKAYRCFVRHLLSSSAYSRRKPYYGRS